MARERGREGTSVVGHELRGDAREEQMQMSAIVVKMLDGSKREFPHENRSGGSWENSLRYEPGFVVVTSVYGKETAIPTALVAEVEVKPDRY